MKTTWRPVWIAALLGFACFAVAVLLGGAGHGTLVPLLVMFPLGPAVANTGASSQWNEVAGIVAALGEWPLYAALICIGARRGSARTAAGVVVVLHLCAMMIAWKGMW